VLTVHDRSVQLVSDGVSATAMEKVDFTPLLRAREDSRSSDVDAVIRRREELLGVLDGLT